MFEIQVDSFRKKGAKWDTKGVRKNNLEKYYQAAIYFLKAYFTVSRQIYF